jgi:6-phosphofructokinase 1
MGLQAFGDCAGEVESNRLRRKPLCTRQHYANNKLPKIHFSRMSSPSLTLSAQPVALLFSGGDAPGMNACLRAVTRLGLNRHQVPVLGIRNGYKGLVDACKQVRADGGYEKLRAQIEERTGRWGMITGGQNLILMDHASVSGIVRTGGIVLGSARCLDFHEKAVRAEAVALLKNLGVRALVVCGGDGSLTGAKLLAEESDLRVIGIPATIDNDLDFTEMALGVDTALNTLTWAVDHFKDTARSHRRVMILETMGRASGELARMAAIASGAEVVITPNPNRPLTRAAMERLAASIAAGMRGGRSHTIVLIAEGVEFAPEIIRNRAYVLADAFKEYFQRTEDLSDLEIRPSVLGHLQRGGLASPQDSILAARFSEAAMEEAIKPEGRSGITALKRGRVDIVSYDAMAIEDRRAIMQDMEDLHGVLSSW